ncbi:MAG TPA: DinB family protein [Vicinamibacterales bacterium]|nr:DinB family protein [Vicinamibacterales bacterium]
MNHHDLTTMLDFHYWARDRVVAAAARLTPEQYTRVLQSSFASVRDTLVHMYSAERNWYDRWHGSSPTTMLDPVQYPDVATLEAEWLAHERKMRAFLASLDDAGVARVIEYRSLQGQGSASAVWEMIHHVVNHGTYHRGQVQTLFRQLGAPPSQSVDLIVFYRERHAVRSAADGRRRETD